MEPEILRIKALEIALATAASNPQRTVTPDPKTVVDAAEIYYAFLANQTKAAVDA
jgi:hypothetical protein